MTVATQSNKKLAKEMKNPHTNLITVIPTIQKIKIVKCKKCKQWSPATDTKKGEKGILIVKIKCWHCKYKGTQEIKKSQRIIFKA